MDLKINTSKRNFKGILSLIPDVYAKDFESLKAAGSVEMSAWAKGVMKENVYPAFDASLKVNNGSFSYESLPGSVDDIQIEAGANSPGGSLNNMKAEMKKFHFLLAGNPFDLQAAASHFETDLNFRASASGNIYLSKIQTVYPS